MKKLLFLSSFLLAAVLLHAQETTASKSKRPVLNATSIVKDPSGAIYPYVEWKQLLQTGSYAIKQVTERNGEPVFIISQLTEEQRSRNLERSPRPTETAFFTTGNKFAPFKTKDITGKKYNIKELAGKVIVINFWFINCPPCRREIPELNDLVKRYANDTSVVFIAIALDSRSDLKTFLKENPYNYNIIDDGSSLAGKYGVTAFPTHVILDKQGIVRFHTSGFGWTTMHWINKIIEDLKNTN
jgi:thiol-disulfide isomerase/thioredoxin